jgi:acyl-CoA thioester hydrolase
VRFSECDMYGHVNNATYLSYLEHARVQLLEDISLPLSTLTQQGYFLYIVQITIEYKQPASLNDQLEVVSYYIKKARTGGTFQQTIYRDSELIADATVKWVCVDGEGKPIRLPKQLAELEIPKGGKQ